MVSKEVALDLRKFKMNIGSNKTPSKRSKSRGEEDQSPTVRFEDSNLRQRSRGKSNDP